MLIAVNFHYIRERFDTPYPSIFGLTPNQFENQIEILAKEGDFISLEDIIIHIKNNTQLKGNYICITFDDGLQEQFDLAIPILRRKGIPYICFVNPSNLVDGCVSIVHQIHLLRSQISSVEIMNMIENSRKNNNDFCFSLTKEERKKAHVHYNFDNHSDAELKYILNFKLSFSQQKELVSKIFNQFFNEKEVSKKLYMDKETIKKIADDNCLGSHTYHHFPLGMLSEEEISKEISESQSVLTSIAGKKIEAISYPYGSLEACAFPVVKYAQENHFVLGFTMERAANGDDIFYQPLSMARFDCNDVVGGKYSLFKQGQLFRTAALRKWNIYA